MATTTPAIFRCECAWKPELIRDAAIVSVIGSNKAVKMANPWNPNEEVQVRLCTDVTNAIIELAKGPNSTIGVVRYGAGAYAAEWTDPSGKKLLAVLNNKGQLAAASETSGGVWSTLPTFGNKNTECDTSGIMAMIMTMLYNGDIADPNTPLSAAAKVSFDNIVTALTTGQNATAMDELYFLNALIYFGAKGDKIKLSMRAGNIDMLQKSRVQYGSFSGEVLYGNPATFMGANATATTEAKATVLADAKKMFEAYTKNLQWTNAEEALIPVFPDDYPVPAEAIKIASRFVKTRGSKRPMNNFFWRGITSYGKSTGIELLAAMLHTPLLRFTCSSTTELQDFLSQFVPDNSGSHLCEELPSFMDIMNDPDGAYEMLTGEVGASNNDFDKIMEAYAKAVLAKNNGGATQNSMRFKLVESPYVRALQHGYIVEVQEISRIKDAGVMVGLNEYDRSGAVIPLVDGGYCRRHHDAMVCYTDNVGYASCRPIDPSVLRRMSFIIDSFEMPKKQVIDRVRYNTGCTDENLMEHTYDVWHKISEFCRKQEITEGSVSVTELEMWVMTMMLDGANNIRETCRECVVAKATSDRDEQESIMSEVVDLALSTI